VLLSSEAYRANTQIQQAVENLQQLYQDFSKGDYGCPLHAEEDQTLNLAMIDVFSYPDHRGFSKVGRSLGAVYKVLDVRI
jgi:hypothetical protein